MSLEITVYGTEQLCASCVSLPSAKETSEWIEAAVSRKYPKEAFTVRYCDFSQPQTSDDKIWADRIIHEDLWYPLVVISGEIVGEGNPKLTNIYAKFEEHGIELLEKVTRGE